MIFEAFRSEQYVEKIISFMSIEEKKGKDTFSCNRFTMFQVSQLVDVIKL